MASVLLVEDDADTSDAVSRFLQNAGHEVHCAVTGREALSSLLVSTPDVIVLDVRLPEMDGVAFLDVARSYYRWSQLPVVLVTAYASGPHIEKARELGVRHIFVKANYELNDLLTAVNEQAANKGKPPPVN